MAVKVVRPRGPDRRIVPGNDLEGVGGAAVVLDGDPALFGERVDAGGAAESAVAGVLDAAEGGHGFVGDALVVDVDDAGPDVCGDVEGGGEVAGDDPAGQPVVGVVGQVDGGLGGVDGVDDGGGPEDLGGVDVHGGGDVGQDGRVDQRLVRPADPPVAGEQGGAFRGGVFDERRDALRAAGVDQGPDDRGGVGGVPGGQRADPLGVPGEERVEQAAVDDDPVGGHAQLPGVHERPEDRGVDREVRVGVLEDDQRVLPAELEHRGLEVLGGLDPDDPPHAGRAGE